MPSQGRDQDQRGSRAGEPQSRKEEEEDDDDGDPNPKRSPPPLSSQHGEQQLPSFKDQAQSVSAPPELHLLPYTTSRLPPHHQHGASSHSVNGGRSSSSEYQVVDMDADDVAVNSVQSSSSSSSNSNTENNVDADELLLTLDDDDNEEDVPSYKDQVRPSIFERAQQKQGDDQADEDRPASTSVHADPIVDVDAVLDDGIAGNNPARHHERQPSTKVYEAQAYALPGGIFVSRRKLFLSIGAAILLLVVAASVVVGVCLSGFCERKDGEYATGSADASSTLAPTNVRSTAPSISPTFLPTLSPDTRELVNFINSITYLAEPITYPPSEDGASPEQLAIQWLLQNDPLMGLNPGNDSARLTQRYALVTFWYSTGGPSWASSQPNNDWLVTDDECSWRGVECINGAVSELGGGGVLRSNNLAGSLPPDFALLQSLASVDLVNNPNLSGSIPAALGDLKGLFSFKAMSCGLSGTLPESLGLWTAMENFDVSSNRLSSTIPSSFSSWSSISFFNVAENAMTGRLPELGEWDPITFDITENTFTGEIPSSWANWNRINVFQGGNNKLSGTLPEFVGSSWRNLLVFRIEDNKISGSLPDTIQAWSNLQLFFIAWNEFTGTLSESIGYWLPNLNVFSIGSPPYDLSLAKQNRFRGTLPASIGLWSNLATSLAGNHLTGSLPESISAWTSLQYFEANANHFTGTLSPLFGAWQRLKLFNLGIGFDEKGRELRATNAVEGTLPETLALWTDLENFWIYNNSFTGSIPSSYGAWKNLEVFDVSYNSLSSTLPSSIGMWSALIEFSVDGNVRLLGSLPTSIAGWGALEKIFVNGTSLSGTLPSSLCANSTKLTCVADVDCLCCNECL